MRVKDVDYNGLGPFLEGKKIIFFGAGAYLKSVEMPVFENHKKDVLYIVDNNAQGKRRILEKTYNVFKPSRIKEESEECVVVLLSPIYALDMYLQLERMSLPDNIWCISLPFVLIDNPAEDDEKIREKIFDNSRKQVIPKIIHCFWFSGEKKPRIYQKCLNSWKEKCTDYEIIEWTQENYDCTKHPFLKKAIDERMWAFATDFARVDVLNQMGGWYMDLDVEVIRPIDALLGNEAVYSFYNRSFIDTAVFATKKHGEVISDLYDLYLNTRPPESKEGFKKFFPPAYEKDCFKNMRGLRFDGTMQKIGDTAFLSNRYLLPMDLVLLEEFEANQDTYTIHFDNFGWGDSQNNERDVKRINNRKLKDIFSKYGTS